MMKCAIQWINTNGNATPDTNDAVQFCRSKAHEFDCDDGRFVHVAASPWFPICAAHSVRLDALGNWESAPFMF